MHRRQFLQSLVGALTLPHTSASALQLAEPGATPALPRHHGGTRPIVLGDGIELFDYRIYPSPDVPRIIGEIISTRDDMVDAPVVSVSFPDLGADGLAYAPPHLPVMRPGESNLIFGVLPRELDTEEKLASARFGLCGPDGPGTYTGFLFGSDLRATIESEGYLPESLSLTGKVHNAGNATVAYAAVYGLVRDGKGRYAGVTVGSQLGPLAPQASLDYALWASVANSTLANPFLLLDGATDYTVEPHPSVLKPFTLPGCPAILPWITPEDQNG